MRAQTTFFHEGYDLLRQFDPFMTMVESKVDVLVKNSRTVAQEMELRHTYVSPRHLEVGGASNEWVGLLLVVGGVSGGWVGLEIGIGIGIGGARVCRWG